MGRMMGNRTLAARAGAMLAAVIWIAGQMPALAQSSPADTPAPQATTEVAAAAPPRDPSRGAVTNLPLPRYVSLKSGEGNARRGPGRTHRIDWVFTRAGMPLRITAEHEHWRRVEDMEGAGGWVHYSLLSGVRTALVAQDMAELRAKPDDRAQVVLQAEMGVIARLLECSADWCRLGTDEGKGWVRKTALWGVEPGEIVE
jgi:SH3-like domain-containing protein